MGYIDPRGTGHERVGTPEQESAHQGTDQSKRALSQYPPLGDYSALGGYGDIGGHLSGDRVDSFHRYAILEYILFLDFLLWQHVRLVEVPL